MVQQPDWLAELVDVVARWNGTGVASRDHRTDESRPEKIGPVEQELEETGSGWYSIVLRGKRIDVERTDEAFLAPEKGPEKLKYGVQDAAQDGEVLRVRVASHAPHEGLFLWASRPGKGRLRKSLVECLQKVRPDGPHAAFGHRRPDPVEPRRETPSGLNQGQIAAYEACMSPGLQLIWGPPGTGKTQVIATAVEQLVREDKSVLLVSGTNVAVDNALMRAAGSLGPDDEGVMIRVGTPHVPDVARNPLLSLNELRKRRAQHKEDQRQAVEANIKELRSSEIFTKIQQTETRLDGFDPEGFADALGRIENSELRKQAMARCAEDESVLARQRELLDDAERRLANDRDAWQRIQPQARALDEAEDLTRELDRYRLQHARTASALQDAQEELDAAEQEKSKAGAGMSLRLSERRRRRNLEERVTLAQENLNNARAAERTRREVLDNSGSELRDRIRRCLARAAPITKHQVTALHESLRLREDWWREQKDAYGRLEGAARANRQALIVADEHPQPTDADRRLVERAEAEDLPGLQRRLGGLRVEVAGLLQRIARLERRHEQLVEELRELGRNAERDIISSAKVVATTLDLLRLKSPLHTRRYDVVIVDEAAASILPAIVFAASLADTGAVLMGDFLQNAPIVEDQDRLPEGPERAWLEEDCFSFFGVRKPADAEALPGCVALSKQYRFGKSINDLANRIAYDGLLQVASRNASEIVFVDVDGLGEEYSQVHPRPDGTSKWWTVGALLARAIGEHHVAARREPKLGIVTPYRGQREAIEFLLGDGGPAAVEVNTSHGFQGRQFDTVVFDLVEDGKGWMAKAGAHGDSFALDGLRLFTVAITRARHRLYVIGNGAVVARARSGPLKALQEFIGSGDVQVVPAREVLGAPEPAVDDGPLYDVWDALRTYVKVVDIYDEDLLPAELRSYIERARHSIWIWSPWVGTKVWDFLPALERAQYRGVSVRVLTRPAKEVSRSLHSSLEALRTRIRHVVCLWQEHQKLVVIDEQLVFMGSMNVLSHSGSQGPREIMTLIDSRDFARRVLRQERAAELVQMPTCPECGGRMWVVKLSRRPKEYGLHWWCRSLIGGADPKPCRYKKFFPDDPKGRNRRPSRK